MMTGILESPSGQSWEITLPTVRSERAKVRAIVNGNPVPPTAELEEGLTAADLEELIEICGYRWR
jgi:hypothetical protein